MPGFAPTPLPPLDRQAERLIDLGVHEVSGLSARDIRSVAAIGSPEGALLVVHPCWAPASRLAPLMERDGKAGFVVVDMPDVD